MTNNQRWGSFVALGGLGLGALTTAWWVFSVDTQVAVVPVEEAVTLHEPERWGPTAGAERPAPRRRRPRTEGKATKAARGDRRAERPPPEPRERVLEPDELMWARTEFREARLADMNDRLDTFAAEAGLSEAVAEEVRALMTETIDEITNQLLRVDAGEIEWAEMRRDMRAFREQQAHQVEALLGPEQFKGFVSDMGFSRFEGEEPTSGRVRMRRRGGRRAAQR